MTKENQSFFEKNAVLIKVAAIAFLTLVLLIPMSMIMSLVMERQTRQREATTEISSKWGYQQKITGPILTVPYQTYDLDKDQKRVNINKHFAYFLPESLIVNGKLNPEVRKRGIFEIAVYTSSIELTGSFKTPQIEVSDRNYEIDWKGAFITLGISDLKGISDVIKFKFNNSEMVCEPGVKINGIVESGVTINNPLQAELKPEYQFSIGLSLNGSKSISFIPVGKETRVSLASTWNNPSFDGSFLPEKRNVTDAGFTADWKILELNRNFPQKWDDTEVNFENSEFGVSLLLPVETYQITERSMKYAILFIALTFVTFFFVEIMRKLKVHAIQYVLVGFGLCLFYLLLLSLSEQIGFGPAYLVASIGIIAMIVSYAKSIFKNNKFTLILASILILLYGFLYILLQLQDYALLMGSLGLFIILASVMYMSRKIDWYSIGSGNKGEDTEN